MTAASRDTQARKKGEERKRKRRREREREREEKKKKKEEVRREKGTGVPSYETSVQGHTRERGVLECSGTPQKAKKEKRGGKGEEGV